jgi:hypothetical protein
MFLGSKVFIVGPCFRFLDFGNVPFCCSFFSLTRTSLPNINPPQVFFLSNIALCSVPTIGWPVVPFLLLIIITLQSLAFHAFVLFTSVAFPPRTRALSYLRYRAFIIYFHPQLHNDIQFPLLTSLSSSVYNSRCTNHLMGFISNQHDIS